jgi:hypothetical protein
MGFVCRQRLIQFLSALLGTNRERMAAHVCFHRLMFDASLITKFAQLYSYESHVGAMTAGKRIRGGELTRKNLKTIFEWKTKGRGRSRISENSDAEIADAFRLDDFLFGL